MNTLRDYSRWAAAGFVLCVIGTASARADVKLPAVFGDHMVLQQQREVPVWGWAAPGEAVTVSFAGQTLSTTTGSDGAWRVNLQPLKANAAGQALVIKGTNSITLRDVLVGEVWVASGQSNMAFGINKECHAADTLAHAEDPQLRLFVVPKASQIEQQTDIANPAPGSLEGQWVSCSAASLSGNWGWNGFSAVAYYFAREIRSKTGVPVGVIGTYFPGTAAQAWTSEAGLGQSPALAHYVADHDRAEAGLKIGEAAYEKKIARQPPTMSIEQWNATDASRKFGMDVANWRNDAEIAKTSGQPVPPAPPVPLDRPPVKPGNTSGAMPCSLFNGMVAPLVPFAMRGVIWYQGESNGNTPEMAQEYVELFPAMIRDWRAHWGQGDFPFLYVQLAANNGKPGWEAYPVREAQLKTLSEPGTAMASAVDIGNPRDIHPSDKLDVGLRLALAARALVYGEKDLVYSGPLYQAMKVEGSTARITFSHGGGLRIGAPPWAAQGAPPVSTTELADFSIAGADQNFLPAKAVIEGNSVVVSSAQVTSPVAVRYGWSNCPNGNLYNQAGLPASPFRTDNLAAMATASH